MAFVIPIIVGGIVAGFIAHSLKAAPLAAGPAALPILPLIVGSVIASWITQHVLNPPPPAPPLQIPYLNQPLHSPSALVGTLVASLIQFISQVLWPLLQQYFFPGPALSAHA
jgi:uncharacterized membrane protein YeaQ/YmgE (transglycosylase-associated protein family)